MSVLSMLIICVRVTSCFVICVFLYDFFVKHANFGEQQVLRVTFGMIKFISPFHLELTLKTVFGFDTIKIKTINKKKTKQP